LARRGPQYWNEQEEIAKPLFEARYSVKDVRTNLRTKFGKEAELPPERTLYNWKRKYAPRPRERWQREKATAEESALLLPVLAEVASATGGRVRDFDEADAEKLLRFLRIAPDLPPLELFLLNREYQRRPAGETADIDMFLACAPWRSAEGQRRYTRLERLGVVPRDSMVTRLSEWAALVDREFWQEGERKETET